MSAALLAAFVVIETRVEAPLMPLRIFRSTTLAGANAVSVLLGGSFFAFIFIGTLYMQQVLGYSALKAGLAWLAASLTSVAFAGLSQALVTRGSAKLVMAAGMAMIGGGVLWATQVPVHGNFWSSLAGPFIVVGIGTAFAFIPVSIAALAGIAKHEAGLASGLLNTSQQLGGAIGVAIASTIAATHASTLLHQGAIPAAALTSGFQWAFWACGAIGLAAVPVTFLLVRRDELATAVASTSAETPARTRQGLTEPPLVRNTGVQHASARTVRNDGAGHRRQPGIRTRHRPGPRRARRARRRWSPATAPGSRNYTHSSASARPPCSRCRAPPVPAPGRCWIAPDPAMRSRWHALPGRLIGVHCTVPLDLARARTGHRHAGHLDGARATTGCGVHHRALCGSRFRAVAFGFRSVVSAFLTGLSSGFACGVRRTA